MPASNRIESIDSLKFFLMILVIAGHVLEGFTSSYVCAVAYKWIYLFHMPLFIFISGYFSRKKDNKEFLISCWKLIEPLIVFQAIVRGVEYFVSGTISIRTVLTPWWILWYLLSLLYWRIILQLLPDKVLSNSKLVMVCAFVISLLAGFLPLNRFLSLQRTLSFMPFFFLGYYMRDKSLSVPTKYKLLSGLFLILTIAVPLFFSRYLGDLYQADPYGNPLRVFSRLFVFGLSDPMSMAFVFVCPNNSMAANQGKYTMQYLVFHTFLVRILMKVVSHYNLPTSFLAVIIYTLVIVIVICLCTRLPFFSKITNPSSFFLKRNT